MEIKEYNGEMRKMRENKKFGISMNDCDLFISESGKMIFEDSSKNQYELIKIKVNVKRKFIKYM